MNKEDYRCTVTSEILPYFVRDTTKKPMLDEKNVISVFRFSIPELEKSDQIRSRSEKPKKDADGDYVLERKNTKQNKDCTIILEHSISTEIKYVGLQVWRAALLMADFIIHSQMKFRGKSVLELGSGVGLTSVVAAMFAKKVICTDIDAGIILNLLKLNLDRNQSLLVGETAVDELNFFNADWPEAKAKEINSVDIVLAADVIYDNDVTEAFIKTITKILSSPPKKSLYIGLEKRYVFTITDLDSVAPCFEHFKACLESAMSKPPCSQWKVSELPIDFPKYFDYERTKELILIEVNSAQI